MTGFRFSVNVFGIESRFGFAEFCRRAEQDGYDAVFAADHLGVVSPFPLLVAAADATEHLRVGTLVLNAAFWNPVLLARDIATTDVLTDGRLEVGLGAGHMKWEFDTAGIEWEGFTDRGARLAATITALGEHFAMEGYPEQEALRTAYGIPVLRPVQRRGFGGFGPPLIVGGTGDRVLETAAAHADIVSIAGAFQVPGQPPGTFRIGTESEAHERVGFARTRAGERCADIEWHTLLQFVAVTDDRRATAAAVLEKTAQPLTIDELLESPFVLIGTVDEMAARIHRNRDRFGFTHYTVHEPYREPFARVIAHIRRDHF